MLSTAHVRVNDNDEVYANFLTEDGGHKGGNFNPLLDGIQEQIKSISGKYHIHFKKGNRAKRNKHR